MLKTNWSCFKCDEFYFYLDTEIPNDGFYFCYLKVEVESWLNFQGHCEFMIKLRISLIFIAICGILVLHTTELFWNIQIAGTSCLYGRNRVLTWNVFNVRVPLNVSCGLQVKGLGKLENPRKMYDLVIHG